MRLQQQSLEVIRGDGKDLESVMAVISTSNGVSKCMSTLFCFEMSSDLFNILGYPR